jgi:hypothetical protein
MSPSDETIATIGTVLDFEDLFGFAEITASFAAAFDGPLGILLE